LATGLPLLTKPTWKQRPTSFANKKPPSQSKLFIQSFLKEYNKTGEGELIRPTLKPAPARVPQTPGASLESILASADEGAGAEVTHFLPGPVLTTNIRKKPVTRLETFLNNFILSFHNYNNLM
jgi:hypothetical protein